MKLKVILSLENYVLTSNIENWVPKIKYLNLQLTSFLSSPDMFFLLLC